MTTIFLIAYIIISFIIITFSYSFFKEKGIICLYAFFIVLSQLTLNLKIEVLGYTTVLGSVNFSFTFLCIDVLNEINGKKLAQKTTALGVVVLFSLLINLYFISKIAVIDDTYLMFKKVTSNQIRFIVVDILVSYIIFQLVNISLFALLRKLCKDKNLWLRSFGSTIISQIFTAITFYELCFFDILSQKEIWTMILIGLIIKSFIALVEIPFLYFIKKLHKENVPLWGKNITQ